MNIEIVREVLGWCAVINFAILLCWFLILTLARDWIHRLHAQWFHLPDEQFDVIHYAGMAIYKIGIILFNLVPYVALHVVA